jgi:ABC-type nitrate/sulfonate/bicarbonate transport system permease component
MKRTRLDSLEKNASGLAVVALIVVLWWFASHFEWVSRVFLPTPEAAGLALYKGLVTGELAQQTWQTTLRMIQGWLLACLAGIFIGAVIGVSAVATAWIKPTLELLRPLPASAVLPLAIAVLGLGPNMVLGVVAFGALWPVLLATVHGFSTVEPRLNEVARCMRLSRSAFILKIGIPNAMPDILSGMRVSLTIALIVAIVGEMIAAQEGLGRAILMAARSFQAADIFAGLILLGLLGFASNSLLVLSERRALRWQEGH